VPAAWLLVLLFALSAAPLRVDAGEDAPRGGLDAPENIRIEDAELVRNGIGIRSATRLFITADIYAAALYLVAPSSDADQVLDSTSPKQILIRYLYEIGGDDMKRAWQFSFDKNCPEEDCSAYASAIERFLARVVGVAPGDVYTYRFFADRSEIEYPSGESVTIPGGAFSRLLLATWIGKVPPSAELKAGLLALPPE